MIGTTISHYNITEELGSGGMGVVYKAIDTNLDRTVALKFLAPELTRDEDARKRFFYEAKAASSLDHPNICSIYEINESEEGQIFIAMAWYDGESLKETITRGPLKLEQAINYAAQIATGLKQAHEKGIVHRDIKSANIMITKEDQVKIMDFGLAKLSGQTRLTMTGSTVGTVAYMSPEQAQGEKIDHRTDIWSLGVILYEMISGQLPFKGEYEQAIVYGILNDTPEPITGIRTGVPMELEQIVNKAMAKDPKQRYQHIDEIPVDLSNIESTPSGTSQISKRADSGSLIKQPALKRKSISRRIAVALLISAMVITSITTWLFKSQSVPGSKQVIRFTHTFKSTADYDIALSPDGTKIVYMAATESSQDLYLRKIDQLGATVINNTENTMWPFFSPNSRELCFFSDDKLKKVFLDGGPAQTLCDIPGVRGGTWGDDNTIILASDVLGLLRVPSSGGIPEVVLAPESGKISTHYRWPEMLPGSKAVLYTSWEGDTYDESNICVLSLETGKPTNLIKRGTHPLYSPTGHILFGRSSSYWAVPFDAKRLQVTGPEVPVCAGIHIYENGFAEFRISTNGTLIFVPSFAGVKRMLVLVNRHGIETSLTDIEKDYYSPRFSSDGKRIALGIFDNPEGIWIHDVARNMQTPLTPTSIFSTDICWSPDGEKVIFNSDRSGITNKYWIRSDGIGEAKPLFASKNPQFGGTWSADGTLFAFSEINQTTDSDIWLYTTKDSSATPFLNTPNSESSPAISPSGKWIAYVSDIKGQNEIYITRYPGPGSQEPISTHGGSEPMWAPNGRELFYREGDKMMVVSVETEPSLKLGMPEPLFERQFFSLWGSQYDIHPDGQRFLMIKSSASETNQINIVFNWFEVLKQKMALAQE